MLIGSFAAGCSGEREADPEERAAVIQVADSARSILMSHQRFRRRENTGAPAVDTAADIVTDGRTSFFFRSDSIIGHFDSTQGEFLFRLPTTDSVTSEGVLRIRRFESEWRPEGLYIR
jgi:hypothetical protein